MKQALQVEPLRVLVVDDDADMTEGITDCLEPLGYEVMGVSEAKAALNALVEFEPHVTLTDLRLGQGSGLDLLSMIRNSRPETLTIVMTGYASVDSAIQALQFGAYDYLRKPFAIEELLKTLSRCRDHLELKNRQKYAEAQASAAMERLDLALWGAGLGLWDWDLSTGRINFDERFCMMLGTDDRDFSLNFEQWVGLIHPEHRNGVLRSLNTHIEGDSEGFECEYQIRRDDGTWLWIFHCGKVVSWDGEQNPLRAAGTVTDIEARKAGESALKRSEVRFRRLYDSTPSMFFTLDPKGAILSVNHFGATHLEFEQTGLIGRPLTDVIHQEDVEGFLIYLTQCFQEPSDIHTWEGRLCTAEGRICWVRQTGHVVPEEADRFVLLCACEDVTEARKLSEQLSYQASHDSLTGLVNRREFELRVDRVLARARQESSEHALCYLDLDQFKVINDTSGHVAGDELLRQLAVLLRSNLRKGDTLARLGGDEFGILMEYCPLDQARRVTRNLQRLIQDFRYGWEDKSYTIGASFGLVPIDQDSDSIDGLLRCADAACYAAKDQGRNRVHVYRMDDLELVRRTGEMQWVARIHRALEDRRFKLYAQEIIPLGTDNKEGLHCELLLRMEDEQGRIVPPGAFLPAAERYNLSPLLDRYVVQTTFDWLNAHISELDKIHLVAVNLSGLSLGDEQFLDFVVEQLENHDVPADKLCFEITETAAISNLTRAKVAINTLKERGCTFSLDDFGSGLSSFAYLRNLPVDYLKIDGVFVRDIAKEPVDLAMVRSINEIAHVMDKQTIAEFVEDEAILECLRSINIDFAQGYHIGRPRPLDELLSQSVAQSMRAI